MILLFFVGLVALVWVLGLLVSSESASSCLLSTLYTLSSMVLLYYACILCMGPSSLGVGLVEVSMLVRLTFRLILSVLLFLFVLVLVLVLILVLVL